MLVSYPIEANLLIGVLKSLSNFRFVDALVQGRGCEHLRAEFKGNEPGVKGVLAVTGMNDRGPSYGTWNSTLVIKYSRRIWIRLVLRVQTIYGIGCIVVWCVDS